MAVPLHAARLSHASQAAPIRLMLVDDSLVARSILSKILTTHDAIDIVCEAETADAALTRLAHVQVDLILLDIEMPQRSGLDALPDMLARADGANIMVVSSFAEESGPAAIQALSLGACDTLAKPGKFGYSSDFAQILIDKVLRIGRAARRPKHEQVETRAFAPDTWPLEAPKCIAIGSSTGGLPAIYEIVGSLNPALDTPVLVTQHLPAAFMPFFAKQLAANSGRDVRVAKHGDPLLARTIYLAPGDAHLTCRKGGKGISIELLEGDCGSHYRPSVDVMFESVAECFGSDALAIVCSGMGRDGALGAQKLAAAGATIFVQDAESSVVWGMPGAVAKNGDANAVLRPAEMVRLLSRMVQS